MLKHILLVCVIMAGVFLLAVQMKPSHFRISRSTTIAAPAVRVFAEVNDLHRWEAWSPWIKLDPMAKSTFEGPAAGTGAAMTWAGNHQVGEGRMTIVDSRPGELVRLKLEFMKPFRATNEGEFTFKPEGNRTVVTWSMSGTSNFIGKAMSLMMNCDKMIGGQFEKGLASMKIVAESKRA